LFKGKRFQEFITSQEFILHKVTRTFTKEGRGLIPTDTFDLQTPYYDSVEYSMDLNWLYLKTFLFDNPFLVLFYIYIIYCAIELMTYLPMLIVNVFAETYQDKFNKNRYLFNYMLLCKKAYKGNIDKEEITILNLVYGPLLLEHRKFMLDSLEKGHSYEKKTVRAKHTFWG
jgi:hypothetical protein